MKNNKTKIVLSAIICLSVVGFFGIADAAGPSLYILPASLIKTAGNIFNVSVGFNALGSRICAVEGTLVFNNLSCQSITVASDVMAQSSPTCLNPHFLIGIPNCATSDKVLLTASVKAGSAGTASINATGVDIIGEGASVGSASTSGNYTINAILAANPAPAPTPKPILTPTPAQQTAQPTEQTTEQGEAPVEQAIQETAQEPSVTGQQASLATASPARTITIIAIVLLIIAIIGGGWYMLSKKKKSE